MKRIINWLEVVINAIPLPLLEVWGQFSFAIGLVLAAVAFFGFTFRLGNGWGFGRERHAWNARAFISIPVTFLAVLSTAYVGSFVVLVPGAQTLESLKDLAVLLCVVLFGYPALLTVPFAYGLSDVIEGVDPRYLLSWWPGYFINPACFWLGYQLFGKAPNFRRGVTWAKYLIFVACFESIEPALWGHICSGEFTPEVSYRAIVPALMFTTGITWIMAPPAFLLALPLARRAGLFWAEIPGHVREVELASSNPKWESGLRKAGSGGDATPAGIPVRMFLLMPFVALMVSMVGGIAYVNLRAAEEDAIRLTARLHEEISQNIQLELQRYLSRAERGSMAVNANGLAALLSDKAVARDGFATIIDRAGRVIASSDGREQTLVLGAVAALSTKVGAFEEFGVRAQFGFDHVVAKPLSRETWLAQASAVPDQAGSRSWILITALPEAFYLADIRESSSQAAIVFAVALMLCLVVAAALASLVTAPLRRISNATQAVSSGQTLSRLPVSRLEELSVLTQLFNDMVGRIESDAAKRQRAEAELREHRDRLEQLVQERTLELERSEQRTKGILENLADGVITIGTDGIVQGFSAAAAKIFGYQESEVVGQNVSMLMPEAYGKEHDAYIERYLRTGEARIIGIGREVIGLRKDGVEFPMDLAIADVGLSSERLFTGVVRDISERKRAEVQLREAKEQADAASRAKSAFLANMSHEIRTPMNAILGFGQLLARDEELTQSNRDRVAKILKSGSHLLEIINQVLEMSKIEAGHMHIESEPFDVHEAVNDVLVTVRERVEAKGLSLRVQGISRLPRYVRSDVARIRQILFNVVGNAVKFTERGRVTIRLGAVELDDAWRLHFSVQDTGVGIAPDELSKVFEPFEQTRSGVAARTGTGLGVPISREIARCLGGDMRIRSEPGKGTIVDVDLVVGRSSWAEVSGRKREPVGVVPLPETAYKPIILVVDDQEDNRVVLAELLTSVGFEVRSAWNGVEAVELFAHAPVDFVFMDLKMPEMDGTEAVRQIRELEGGADVPIVMLSASVLDSQPVANGKFGCDAFIRKPFQESEIWDVIERHLDVHLQRRVDGNVESQPDPLTEMDMDRLGVEVRAALRAALELGDMDRATELLDALDARHSKVVASLRQQLTSFDLDGLLARL